MKILYLSLFTLSLFLQPVGTFAQSLRLNPKINSLIQVWGVSNNPAANIQSANGEDVDRRGVLIRRAEFAISENRDDGTTWALMFDPSKGTFNSTGDKAGGDPKVLQDLFIGYTFSKYLTITIGQFLIPTTLEGLEPSGELVFSERSYLGRSFGDIRDVGVQLSGSFRNFHYKLANFNGQGINQGAGSSMRQLIGNFGYKTSRFNLGIWNSYKQKESDLDEGVQTQSDQRDSVIGAYGKVIFNKFTFQAEFIKQAKQNESVGHYLMGKYQINKSDSFGIRYDYMKDNPMENTQNSYDFGIERIYHDNLKLKMDLRGGSEESTGEKRDIQEAIFQIQLAI